MYTCTWTDPAGKMLPLMAIGSKHVAVLKDLVSDIHYVLFDVDSIKTLSYGPLHGLCLPDWLVAVVFSCLPAVCWRFTEFLKSVSSCLPAVCRRFIEFLKSVSTCISFCIEQADNMLLTVLLYIQYFKLGYLLK